MNNPVSIVSLEGRDYFCHFYFVFEDIDTMKNVHRLYYLLLMFEKDLDVNDEYDTYLTLIELEVFLRINYCSKHHYLKQKEIHENEIDSMECY